MRGKITLGVSLALLVFGAWRNSYENVPAGCTTYQPMGFTTLYTLMMIIGLSGIAVVCWINARSLKEENPAKEGDG